MRVTRMPIYTTLRDDGSRPNLDAECRKFCAGLYAMTIKKT